MRLAYNAFQNRGPRPPSYNEAQLYYISCKLNTNREFHRVGAASETALIPMFVHSQLLAKISLTKEKYNTHMELRLTHWLIASPSISRMTPFSCSFAALYLIEPFVAEPEWRLNNIDFLPDFLRLPWKQYQTHINCTLTN